MLCTLLPVLALVLAVVTINILQTSRLDNAKKIATRFWEVLRPKQKLDVKEQTPNYHNISLQ